MDTEQIHVILKDLDVKNDKLWTHEGLPRISVFKDLITRTEISDAAPEFCRTLLKIPNLVLPNNMEDVKNVVAVTEDETNAKMEAKLISIDTQIAKASNILGKQEQILIDLETKKYTLQNKIKLKYPVLNPSELIQEHIKLEQTRRIARIKTGAKLLDMVKDKIPIAMRSVIDRKVVQKVKQRIAQSASTLKNSNATT